MLRRAVELGVNFIDTADSYGPHVSEELIAEALHPYPDDLVIATKGGLERTGPEPVAVERAARPPEGGVRGQPPPAAPRRDPALPAPPARPEGAVRGLGRRAGRAARTQGKIRHIGLSNVNEAAAAAGAVADAGRLGAEPLQPSRPQLGVDARPVRAGGHRLPARGRRSSRPRRGPRSARSPSATASRARRSCWRGCWRARRRCCRSRAPARSPTSRRTSPRPSVRAHRRRGRRVVRRRMRSIR